MTKALIHGTRVCEIAEEEFPVHKSLKWVGCDDTIVPDHHTYVGGRFVTPPPPPPPTYTELRLARLSSGGYGSVNEQLEMIGEKGVDAFMDHVARVKAAIPKP